MNRVKVTGITCSMELRLLLACPQILSSSRKSGNWLQLNRTVHCWSRQQLHHLPLKQRCHRLKQLSKLQLQRQQQTTNLHTNGSNLLNLPSGNIILGNRIKEALANRSPIVALESTVITHGLPEPDNLRLALSLEEKIESCITRKERETEERAETNIGGENGEKGSCFESLQINSQTKKEEDKSTEVTPATVGIIKGQIIVGLSKDEIEYLATKSESKPIKASRRDISIATALGLSAGTTVSATMAIASSVIRRPSNLNNHPNNRRSHLSAIKVFATGGTGGVHMGGEKSFDISADLFEFAKTPIGVVSSGFKSFLDTKRSLEYLETMGCTVVSLSPYFNYQDLYSYRTVLDDEGSNIRRGKLEKIGQGEKAIGAQLVNDDHHVVVGGKWLNNNHQYNFDDATLKQKQKGAQERDEERKEANLFPGFYSQTNSQKVKSPHIVTSIEEAGKILFQCLEAPLLDRRGFLLAVPIPKEFSLDEEQMITLLANISKEIDMRSDIEGKEKTPMVLERFSRETGGASLRANVELLKNNAQVGALLAFEYSRLENETGAIILPPPNLMGFVSEKLATKNGSINDNTGPTTLIANTTTTTTADEGAFPAPKEDMLERKDESSYDKDACLKHQLSSGDTNCKKGSKIFDLKERVYEKLSHINRIGEKDCENKTWLRKQPNIAEMDEDIGRNFSKQKREDEAKVLHKEEIFGQRIKREPVVIGCTMIDMHVSTKIDDQFKNNPRHSGVTFAGKPHLTVGGVAKNLATALNFLGHKPTLITALADDTLGSFAHNQLLKTGFHHNQLKVVACNKQRAAQDDKALNDNQCNTNNDQSSFSSCFALVLIDSIDGQCEYVIADLESVKAINEETIKLHLDDIKDAPLLVLDANLSDKTIEYLIEICHKFEVPIFIEPTDKLALPNLVTCLKRVLNSSNPDSLKSIVCLSPNTIELKGILELFEGTANNEDSFRDKSGDLKLTQQQREHPVKIGCSNFTKANNKQAYSISELEQKRKIGYDNEREEKENNNEFKFSDGEEQMTLEQIERMATRLMQTHLPQIKCLLVTMDKRGVLVALRSISDGSCSCSGGSISNGSERKIVHEEGNYIESVKLMDKIGSPLSEKIHIKHFKPLKTIEQPISASGAGDSFASGFISGLLNNQNLGECLGIAFEASQLALQDKDTISSKLKNLSSSSESIQKVH